MPTTPSLDPNGICCVCGRLASHLGLSKTSFGLPKMIGPFYEATPNPEWQEFVICGNDQNLFYRIQKASNKSLSVHQILDKAREYRKLHPIKSLKAVMPD